MSIIIVYLKLSVASESEKYMTTTYGDVYKLG